MRLIDADALNIRRYTIWFDDPADIRQVERMIREAPTIEAEPVKHGKWEEHDAEDMMKCPFCGDEWNYIDNDCYRFNYCPNCGAKMDKESDNNA